jgi:DNA-binding transcriptional regulator YiaG
MKYESDIAEMIHEDATINFELGFISEVEMREYDELCLVPEALEDNTANENTTREAANIEHTDLVTA